MSLNLKGISTVMRVFASQSEEEGPKLAKPAQDTRLRDVLAVSQPCPCSFVQKKKKNEEKVNSSCSLATCNEKAS